VALPAELVPALHLRAHNLLGVGVPRHVSLGVPLGVRPPIAQPGLGELLDVKIGVGAADNRAVAVACR